MQSSEASKHTGLCIFFSFQNKENKNKMRKKRGQIWDYNILFPLTLPVVIIIITQEKYKFGDQRIGFYVSLCYQHAWYLAGAVNLLSYSLGFSICQIDRWGNEPDWILSKSLTSSTYLSLFAFFSALVKLKSLGRGSPGAGRNAPLVSAVVIVSSLRGKISPSVSFDIIKWATCFLKNKNSYHVSSPSYIVLC